MKRDVLIVGGAAMGSAVAYYLKSMDSGVSVAVVERDPTYERSSTVLSDGNVRIQFNLEENIRISQYALEVLETFADDMAVGDFRPDVSARHQGNLFLADEERKADALAGMELQRFLGCEVSWVDGAEIVRRWPVFDGPHHVGGTFGPRDGSVDPTAVVRGYRHNAAAMGVEYMEAEVDTLLRSDDRIIGVRLAGGDRIAAPVVINCAGAWSPGLLAGIGVDIPVEPVMRNVFIVESHLEWEDDLPSVFVPSGLYVLPERDGTFLVGWSRPDDPVGFDFTVRRSKFYDLIWPELVDHFPAFDQLEIAGSWAGLYAVNTLDGNAILGEWPEVRGLHMCTGFSGHGFQQCHAVGRYLAELVLERDHAIDLSRLGPQRIIDGEPLYEHAGRLI
ncbi:MAG: FAD-dependent oxidoreductase [Acidimicrobiia bacterium]